MGERLVECYDEAVEDSPSDSHLGDLGDLSALVSYLADVHAIEQQAIALLERASTAAGDPLFTEVYERHLERSREHADMIKRRLAAHDARPSTLKDSAMRFGGLNWSAFFRVHPDTPGKLAVFTYAFEHLEIASYELLSRVARRAGDDHTCDACEQILMEERMATGRSPGRSSVLRTRPSRKRRRGLSAQSPRRTITLPRDYKVAAGANGSLDVIAETAKRRRFHHHAARRFATSASGGEIRIHGLDGKSANLMRPRRRIHALARLSLPRPSATRGWR
jgi:ferritin-like metal-binding protein YciE